MSDLGGTLFWSAPGAFRPSEGAVTTWSGFGRTDPEGSEMDRTPKRLYWLDTPYDRLDRQKLAKLAREAGFPFVDEELAEQSRRELIDLLMDVVVEAQCDASEVGDRYPLRRPIRTPMPSWLAPVATGARVHLRWVENRPSVVALLRDRDADLDVPRRAAPGDVVVTVVGCTPPLVAAVERITGTGEEQAVEREVIVQPVPWEILWGRDDAQPAQRSTRLSRQDGERLVDAVRQELKEPRPYFIAAGECGSPGTSQTIVDALAVLQVDHPKSALESRCTACGSTEQLEVHIERPIHENVLLEIQDHLDDLIHLCQDCHVLMHPHPVAAVARALRPACPECGARGARRVVFGFPSYDDFDDDDVHLGGCVAGPPLPRWRCRGCHEEFLTISTTRLAALRDVEEEGRAIASGGGASGGRGHSAPIEVERMVERRRKTSTPEPSSPGPLAGEMRLASTSGAAFTLSATLEPDPDKPGALDLSYDIGLISPDRHVRYLRRHAPGLADRLVQTLWRAASALHPELDVADEADQRSGFTLALVGSDAETVTIEVTVVADPEADVPEYDGLNFEIRRADLIAASHRLQALHDSWKMW